MFKSEKPPGQPRTLRSIVESQNDSANFPPPVAIPPEPVSKQPPCPDFVGRRDTAAGKSPFKGTK